MLSEQQVSILTSCRLSTLLCSNRGGISRKDRKIVEKLLVEIEHLSDNLTSTLNRSKVILVSKLIDVYPEILNPVSTLLKSYIDKLQFGYSLRDNSDSEFCKVIIFQWTKCCSRSNDLEKAKEWLIKQLEMVCTNAVATDLSTIFESIADTCCFIDWRGCAYDIFKCAQEVARYGSIIINFYFF